METQTQQKPRYRIEYIDAKELLARFIFDKCSWKYIDAFKMKHFAKIVHRDIYNNNHIYQFISKI